MNSLEVYTCARTKPRNQLFIVCDIYDLGLFKIIHDDKVYVGIFKCIPIDLAYWPLRWNKIHFLKNKALFV